MSSGLFEGGGAFLPLSLAIFFHSSVMRDARATFGWETPAPIMKKKGRGAFAVVRSGTAWWISMAACFRL